MKNFFEKLWVAPFAVKASAVFLFFVALILFLASPGKVLFTMALIYAVFNFLDWMIGNE